MSFADDMIAMQINLMAALGSSATLQKVVAGVEADGTVSETVTEHAISCYDIVDESKRYAVSETSTRAVGTMYSGALSITPAVGDRIVYRARTFAIVAVSEYVVQGRSIGWRMDVSETG